MGEVPRPVGRTLGDTGTGQDTDPGGPWPFDRDNVVAGAPLECWWHGEEVIPEDVYRVCMECGHAWTLEALEAADAERYPDMGRRPAEDIFSCPLCVHDF